MVEVIQSLKKDTTVYLFNSGSSSHIILSWDDVSISRLGSMFWWERRRLNVLEVLWEADLVNDLSQCLSLDSSPKLVSSSLSTTSGSNVPHPSSMVYYKVKEIPDLRDRRQPKEI